jgi:hypothetical protein
MEKVSVIQQRSRCLSFRDASLAILKQYDDVLTWLKGTVATGMVISTEKSKNKKVFKQCFKQAVLRGLNFSRKGLPHKDQDFDFSPFFRHPEMRRIRNHQSKISCARRIPFSYIWAQDAMFFSVEDCPGFKNSGFGCIALW